TDKDNATGTTTKTITVTDVTPTISIVGAPNSGQVGTPIALTSNVSSPSPTDMATGFRYAWSVNKDGKPFASATTANFNFTPVDHGTYVVTVVATDKDNATAKATATINVTDVPPAVGIQGAPASGPKGTTIALTSTVLSP